ncbi:MAG: hypothetical protein JST84_21615 [Acidobacteria bacterium]|nr:hypothetical protein [Acidobacteriota bacterium]
MPRIESDHAQEEYKQHISELKGDIAKLAAHRAALEEENHRHSPLMQKLGKYVGFGAAGKLEWVCFKLNFKQEELARLSLQAEAHSNEAVQNGAKVFSLVPASQARQTNETAQQKMERMIAENPPALKVHIQQVYQPLIEAEQREAH